MTISVNKCQHQRDVCERTQTVKVFANKEMTWQRLIRDGKIHEGSTKAELMEAGAYMSWYEANKEMLDSYRKYDWRIGAVITTSDNNSESDQDNFLTQVLSEEEDHIATLEPLEDAIINVMHFFEKEMNGENIETVEDARRRQRLLFILLKTSKYSDYMSEDNRYMLEMSEVYKNIVVPLKMTTCNKLRKQHQMKIGGYGGEGAKYQGLLESDTEAIAKKLKDFGVESLPF